MRNPFAVPLLGWLLGAGLGLSDRILHWSTHLF